ncbi:MAG: glutamine-hydrolyzing GMP synthase [Deltaproteobacteria bacterium]|nr:glutamine-hydrolyzing GMP synthase [Deltaproteobacteria bacterium]
MKAQLLILDFGSQYTQLIARTVRELGVYCEIVPGNTPGQELLGRHPSALILSGGPASVNSKCAPKIDEVLLHAGIPVFGICYGMQLIATVLGGRVGGWGDEDSSATADAESAQNCVSPQEREFGPSLVKFNRLQAPFLFDVSREHSVWMSHGDKVLEMPRGFEILASSKGSPIAAFGNIAKKIYGVQFHPEVHHTPIGKDIIKSFLFDIAELRQDWNPVCFATEVISAIKEKVPSGRVICALSGGVDSTVAALLVHRAIGERLVCVFVDNGLLREGEREVIERSLKSLELNVCVVDAAKRFLGELRGISNPEEKRKIIGRIFIEIFEEKAALLSDVQYLVQGTLYPDVIESISVVGQSHTIKSHHNVGGLIDNMKLGLIEPLRELFKDEVRAVGRGLGISEEFIIRQPFPGPGLAIRCLGEVTEERLAILRKADFILREEVHVLGLEEVLWQVFAVLLPVYSVGVMGDARTYEQAVAIRAVTSRDGMTADWYMLPEEALRRISARIINETSGVNRVVLDISTKPPATIEWE